MTRPLPRPLLGMALAAAAAPALAQGLAGTADIRVDPDSPFVVTSDTLEIAGEGGATALFEGNVLVVQGDLKLAASTVRIVFAAAEAGGKRRIETVEASGGARIASGTQTVSGDRITYRLGEGAAEVVGNARIEQNGSSLRAERIALDFAEGTAVMLGGSGGQVRAVLGQAPAGDDQ